MKLKRIVDLKLEKFEKITIPKNEQWLVSLYSVGSEFGGSITENSPNLFVEDFPMQGLPSGRVIGFCFSDSSKGEIRLKKYSNITISLKEGESWAVPDGKILVARTRRLDFIPATWGKYYINGGTRLDAKEDCYLTGILFSVEKE